MTLRVAQFVLKIPHLAISMEPRGPHALLSPTALMAPVILILKLDLLTSQAFERVARL